MKNTFEPPKCKCGAATELVGNWADGDDDIALYQCPKCKNIEMKVLNL